MIFKNRPGQGIHIFARDTGADEGKTGDAANLHAFLSLDNGVAAEMDATLSGTIIEVGLGAYYCPFLQSETNADAMFLGGTSDTVGVVVDPMVIVTEGGAIPKVPFATNGGLGTVNASNQIPGIAGNQNTFDAIAGPGFSEAFQLDKTASLAALYAEIKKLFDAEPWPELAAVPGATPTTVAMLMWFYHQARQKFSDNRTSGMQTVYNDAGDAIGEAPRSDSGTEFTREKFQDVS